MRSSNLAIALWCLPRERRKDALFFYSFCRAVDDIADNVEMLTAEKLQRLDEWDAALATGTGLPEELAAVMHRHELSPALLREIVAGCRRDVSDTPIVYETFEELRDYCWQVAGAVGVAAARIFGAHSPQARDYAEHLGLALQLTNIIRDVREDAEMRRVYLPIELCKWKVENGKWKVGTAEPAAQDHAEGAEDNFQLSTFNFQLLDTPVLRMALARLADTAESEFVQAGKILRYLPAPEVVALRPARLMAELYSFLLLQMRRRGFDSMLRRPTLSLWCKIKVIARWLVIPFANRK